MSEGTLVLDEPREIAAPAEERLQASDLRHAMMRLPVEEQNRNLAEYVDRRNNFRNWLRQQFEEGLHFGFPPGCEPRRANDKQWQSKPSLYAAGADLLCDLLALRCEFAADIEAWQQLGSKPGHFVIVCRLFSRADNTLVGEGRGVRKEGQKGGDANNALKMAQKAAKVDAVLNSYGLRDLYSQDLEIPIQPPNDNPEANPAVPVEKPRAARKAPATEVTADQVAHVTGEWKQRNLDPDGNLVRQRAAFSDWARKVTDRQWNPAKLVEWKPSDYKACCAALSVPTLEELQ